MDPPVVSVTSALAPASQFVTGVPTIRLYTALDKVPSSLNVHVLFPHGEHSNIESKPLVLPSVEGDDG